MRLRSAAGVSSKDEVSVRGFFCLFGDVLVLSFQQECRCGLNPLIVVLDNANFFETIGQVEILGFDVACLYVEKELSDPFIFGRLFNDVTK